MFFVKLNLDRILVLSIRRDQSNLKIVFICVSYEKKASIVSFRWDSLV